MNCPTCGAGLDTGQKYCIQCGTNVAALTLPMPPAGPVNPAPPTVAIKPTAAPTVAAPIAALPPPVAPAGPAARADPQQWTGGWTSAPETTIGAQHASTGTQSTVQENLHTDVTPYTPLLAPDVLSIPGRGSTVLAVVAGIAGLAVIIGGFIPVLNIETDAPIPDAGGYKVNDMFLGTSVLLGFVIAGLCMIGGGVLALVGRRIGAGLAAGAALVTIPVAIVLWGAVDLVSTRAEQNAFAIAAAGGGGTFFRSKQDVGLFVVLGGAGLGLVVVIIAAIQSGNDGRPTLNLPLGVTGAVASVLAAIGQLIPGNGRSFSDNFSDIFGSHPVIGGRIALIAVVALAGVVGFLRSNRWGVGLALGGASIWVWQWLSSIASLGEAPAPPGYFAIGGTDFKPHVLTTIGIIVMLVIAVVVLVTAPKPQPQTI